MAGLLNHSAADVLGQLLVDLGLGSAPPAYGVVASAWPVFVTHRPDLPDSLICVTDTQGRLGGKTQPNSEVLIQHGVQVFVRDKQHLLGFRKLMVIATQLDLVRQRLTRVDDQEYIIHNVIRSSDVLPIGNEGTPSKRSQFTLNLLLVFRQQS